MRAVATWLKTNWKPLITMLAAFGAAGYGAVQDVKSEIVSNEERIEAVEREMGTVKSDVRDVRCMIIAQYTSEEPLRCLDR